MNRVFRGARRKSGASDNSDSKSSSLPSNVKKSGTVTGGLTRSATNSSGNNSSSAGTGVEKKSSGPIGSVRHEPQRQQQQQQQINGFLTAQPTSTTTNIASAGSLRLDQGPPAVAVRPTAIFTAKVAASVLIRDSFTTTATTSTTTTTTTAVASSSFSSDDVSNKSNDNNDNTDHVLQTNVQVCARIRPIMIDASIRESESFFHASPKPKKVGLSSSRLRLPSIRTTGPADAGPNGGSSKDSFVAWDVSIEDTTASQSNRTDKIQGRTHSYTLDRIFGTESATRDVYDHSVSSLVESAMEGYHSTVLAYGQTSTGKTHTMTGTKDDPGLIPLCMKDCFRYVQNNTCKEPREYLFRLSYLEVYKEHIRDLLSSAVPPEPVRLFDGPQGLLIRGLKEEVVTSPEQVFLLLKQGERRRQVGATHMNEHSSRSHVMVRLWIESSNPTTKDGDVGNTSSNGKAQHETRVSSLSLVDLAGSESVRLNGTDRREEGQYINKSLMTLGQVVLSLSDASASGTKKSMQHIPYRDSKLTRLLQPSLSGNAQMLLLCCISPLVSHLEESHNTFKFATRAKRIEQKATIQTVLNDEETLLQTYRDEIEDLKQQLAYAKEQHRRLLESQQSPSLHMGTLPATTGGEVSTTATTPMTKDSKESVETVTEEVQELVKAIETMERLILKSRPKMDQEAVAVSEQLADDTLASLLENDDEDADGDEDLLVDDVGPSNSRLAPSFSITPSASTEDQLHSELSRIRGLLGSVLQKRGVVTVPSAMSPETQPTPTSLDFSTPPRTPDKSLSEELDAIHMSDHEGNLLGLDREDEKKAEVETLRRQLEKSEQTTNLRKADSSFLQSQLREKDQLLEEVSNLLEAVEQRQVELEQENAALRNEIEAMKQASRISSSSGAV